MSLMQITVLHIITGLRSRGVAPLLTRVLVAHRESRGEQHVVVSLTEGGRYRSELEEAGAEVHCLGLVKPTDMPAVLFRLIILMRRIRPGAVMTWQYSAHFLGTLAAMASGVGARRVVWNVSGSSPNAPGSTRTTRLRLRLLAVLSPFPWAIAVGSRSGRRAYAALGFRPRRWFPVSNSPRDFAIGRLSRSYRQLWRYVSGVALFSVRPGLLERTFPWLKKPWTARLRRLLLTRTTFIAVTGSCGKTTTTRLATAVLKTSGPCYLWPGSTVFRGSVQSLLSIPASSKYFVQEVSGFPPGDMAMHSRFLRPAIAIVTTIGYDHYKSFRGLEAAAREKGQLIEGLPKHGTAVLNADDPHVRAMASRTRARVLLFGLSSDAEIRATEVLSVWPDRLMLTVVHGYESVRIQTKLVGEHWATSVLAAIACGVACGVDLETCAKAVETINPTFGRYSIHAKPGGAVYVLDSHKAPLWTIPSSLSFVGHAKAPRKTIVFGTISDYSGSCSKAYRKIAREALEVADRVIFVGPNAASVGRLRQGELQKRLFEFPTSYQASALLAGDTLPQELIYVKGSRRADHLERIMLSQYDEVVCWQERCRRDVTCSACRYYHKPHPPSFGLVEKGFHIASASLRK